MIASDSRRIPFHAASDRLPGNFLDDDAAANSGCTRLCHNVQQSHQCLTLCQKIVDNKHMVVRTEKLLRNDNLILTLMRKGFTSAT